jgi:TolB-like protein
MRPLLIPVLAAAAMLTACAANDVPPSTLTEPADARPTVDVELASYAAADQLVEFSRAPLNPDKPIVVATLVDNSDLTDAAPLGRLIAEQMATRLTNAGYTVRELRFATAFKVRQGTGELVLSRDARELSRSVGAQAIIAGTYTQAHSRVFVNAKLIHAASGDLLSAADFELPKSRDVQSLLPRTEPDLVPGRWDTHRHTSN